MWWGNKVIVFIACCAVSSGCCCRGVCTKRADEQCCPTDIRKTHFWCFGEDAIMHGPCGPKDERYGYERTQWREFPAEDCSAANYEVIPAPATHEQPQQPFQPAPDGQQVTVRTNPTALMMPDVRPAIESATVPLIAPMTLSANAVLPGPQAPHGLPEKAPTSSSPETEAVSQARASVSADPHESPDVTQREDISDLQPVSTATIVPTSKYPARAPLIEEQPSSEEIEARRQVLSQIQGIR